MSKEEDERVSAMGSTQKEFSMLRKGYSSERAEDHLKKAALKMKECSKDGGVRIKRTSENSSGIRHLANLGIFKTSKVRHFADLNSTNFKTYFKEKKVEEKEKEKEKEEEKEEEEKEEGEEDKNEEEDKKQKQRKKN
ncbi:hypothetical protein BTVI_105035 [Pitangus sulphuratus]|nr:hypothetical protein BTVI_105035 [Pitangus sulphuratus]